MGAREEIKAMNRWNWRFVTPKVRREARRMYRSRSAWDEKWRARSVVEHFVEGAAFAISELAGRNGL